MANDDPRRAGQDADRSADPQHDQDDLDAADPRRAGRDAADQAARRPPDPARRDAADRS